MHRYISKLIDILITNISAIKHTDNNADTDTAAPMNSLLYCCILYTTFQHLIYVHHIDCLHALKKLDSTLVGGPDITPPKILFHYKCYKYSTSHYQHIL